MKKFMLIFLLVTPFCQSADPEGIGIDIAAIEREGDTLDLSGLGITNMSQIEANCQTDDKVKELNLSNNEIPDTNTNDMRYTLAKLYPSLQKLYFRRQSDGSALLKDG